MPSVLFLGSGTSHGVPMIGCECAVCLSEDPRDNRMRPSVYLELESGTRVLIDTSTDLRQQCLRFGVREVDAVVYTHAHADHILGFDELRRFNVMARKAMPIYGDAATLGALRRAFAYAFEPPAQLGGGVPEVEVHEITGPFVLGGAQFLPLRVMHGRTPVLGFRVGRFAYLTDCNAIPDQTLAQLEGLEVLVLDALRHRPHPTHFSLSEAVEMAGRIGAGQTWFTHCCHDLPHAATNATLPDRMALAYDGLRFACS